MKNVIEKIIIELIGNGIGWITGLFAADIVSYFFVARSWKNMWGVFSFKKEAVSQDTFGMLEWIVAAIIGYIVLVTVNKYIGKPLLKRFISNRKNNEN